MPRFIRFLHDSLIIIKKDPKVVVTNLCFGTIPVRLFQPQGVSCSPRRGIVFYHGGGGMFGSLDSYHSLCSFLARETDSVVFCVGYRQLPDHHYPVIYQDCLNATMKFLKGAGAYGVEPSQAVICGESIGASTVAMVSQALAGRTNLPQIRAQVLISPVLQLLNLQLPSFREMKNVSFLTLDIFMTCLCRYLDNDLFWQAALMKGACILPEDWKKYWKWLSSDNISNRLKNKDQEPQFPGPFNESAYLETKQWLYIKNSALLEDDEIIAQLPEAFLVSYGYDILRDDTMLYKKHLEDRGGGVSQ